MNIRSEKKQGREFEDYSSHSTGTTEPMMVSSPQFTSIQTINDSVHQASAWVRPLEQEISRVIVGQKYLIDRLLVGLL